MLSRSHLSGRHFPNLNGLRFFAALIVLISHFEGHKSEYGLQAFFLDSPFIGMRGVDVFFTLSGFLITYLLLEEIRTSKTIHLKNFYLRRILRIWPLYYFIVILGLFAFPYIFPYLSENDVFSKAFWKFYWTSVGLCLLGMPNIALLLYRDLGLIGHTWSIGVEEQFYVLWPIAIKWAKNHFLPLLLLILLGKFFFEVSLSYILENGWIEEPFKNKMKLLLRFSDQFGIQNMAIGGFFAFLIFHGKYPKGLNNMILQFLMLALSIYICTLETFPFDFFIVPFTFGLLITQLASSSKPIISLENRYLDRFGKVSYGIYMYHNLVISLLFTFAHHISLKAFVTLPTFNLIFYPLCLGLTLLLSHLSYEYLEKGFLKLKDSYRRG